MSSPEVMSVDSKYSVVQQLLNNFEFIAYGWMDISKNYISLIGIWSLEPLFSTYEEET